MSIQIYGRKSCKGTQKAKRFFKERQILFQFVDLDDKEMSPRELQGLFAKNNNLDDLIDKDGKVFRARNLNYMVYDAEEEIRADQKLLKTPIVRQKSNFIYGVKPDMWKTLL